MELSMAMKFNNTLKAKDRRVSAIKRLETQLKIGKKPQKNPLDKGELFSPLSKEDVIRINKELSILKTRI